MRRIRYVRLDPTGNLTCLVLDPVEDSERPGITAELMGQCEQVGYLTAPVNPESRAGLQMMGGEFCGNASMATAAWLAREAGETEASVPLEVSGAEGIVTCYVRRTEDGSWTGTLEMPAVTGIFPVSLEGKPCTAVRMPGITHLIFEGTPEKEEAERLIRTAAEMLPDPAVGLLSWEEEQGRMTPLVYVRESGTLVWETACGSGSTAVGAWRARRSGGEMTTEVLQPGGMLRIHISGNRSFLTGTVRLGEVRNLDVYEKKC